ncbi:pre-rRNA-processing protein TSR2 homolog [Ictalurus punctatus]|uniref:Pre-rRNA-processing protein TSR2 homolog n=1 Tax=Ictalurus punctatus TaxID=7998 RepID=A0A2D0QZ08_ICTPU|nr:pre-rRNA-processing protein TSR2 homolog [Ictalurus punctatus]
MAALVSSPREVFSEAVRAVLETWPVLQIAVDNGFGGVFSQQKADWMVDAVQQYFHDNSDLEQDEVEDFLSELMNNEFDTVVDDGSLPQVAQKVCVMFQQCKQGKLAEVRQHISQLALKKASGRAKVTPVKSPTEDADDDGDRDNDESMECDEAQAGASVSSTALKLQQQPFSSTRTEEEEEEEEGWTVVCRKK